MHDQKLDISLWENVGVAVCVSMLSSHVIFQNKLCENICGAQRGFICRRKQFEPCKSKLIRSRFGEGCHKFSYQVFGVEEYSICVINDLTNISTIIYPMAEKRKREIDLFSDQGLTPKELEVINHLLMRSSKQQIAYELKISENTLKWHIRNIYRKLSSAAKQILLNRHF